MLGGCAVTICRPEPCREVGSVAELSAVLDREADSLGRFARQRPLLRSGTSTFTLIVALSSVAEGVSRAWLRRSSLRPGLHW